MNCFAGGDAGSRSAGRAPLPPSQRCTGRDGAVSGQMPIRPLAIRSMDSGIIINDFDLNDPTEEYQKCQEQILSQGMFN